MSCLTSWKWLSRQMCHKQYLQKVSLRRSQWVLKKKYRINKLLNHTARSWYLSERDLSQDVWCWSVSGVRKISLFMSPSEKYSPICQECQIPQIEVDGPGIVECRRNECQGECVSPSSFVTPIPFNFLWRVLEKLEMIEWYSLNYILSLKEASWKQMIFFFW